MYETCLQKQEKLLKLFSNCPSNQAIYQKIIELGRNLHPLPQSDQIPQNRVRGCQSQMYLISTFKDGLMHYQASSDALISAGLASLLISIYHEETPEAVLKCPPKVLQELKIPSLLSPSRSNGLMSLYTRMQQHALSQLTGVK